MERLSKTLARLKLSSDRAGIDTVVKIQADPTRHTSGNRRAQRISSCGHYQSLICRLRKLRISRDYPTEKTQD